MFAYPFQDVKTRAQSYWRDVGTLDAYYEANIELVHVRPSSTSTTRTGRSGPTRCISRRPSSCSTRTAAAASAINSMVSGGCIISGAVVRESLLFSNVRVEERSSIHRSVVLPNVEIGARLRHQRGDHR